MILSAPHLAAILALPDGLLLAWISSTGAPAITERERAIMRQRLATAPADAARYVRERLATGDHVALRTRLQLDVGATIWIDRVGYTVTRRDHLGAADAHRAILAGPRGGSLELHPPHPTVTAAVGARAIWTAYAGPRCTRPTYLRRDVAGNFTRVAAAACASEARP